MGESRAEVEAETVERVARLVTTAGATLKEKKRPIKVVARDGTIKKVVPHVEVIDGLLHHEGISGELQAGVRPRTILCAVCKCVVEVKSIGHIPTVCKRHNGRKLCPRGCGAPVVLKAQSCRGCKTQEERSESGKRREASLTPEQRNDRRRKRQAARSREERSEATRKANAAMTPEQRSARARKANAAMTPEQRSEIARKIHAAMTPEQRSEIARRRQMAKAPETRRREARKSAATLRAKKAAAEKAGRE